MIVIMLACVASGAALSVPLIRATRRADEARRVIRPGDYLRTRRASRLSRIAANTFAVRS